MFKNMKTAKTGVSYALRTDRCGCGTDQQLLYLSVDGEPILVQVHTKDEPALLVTSNRRRRTFKASVEAFLQDELPALRFNGIEFDSEDPSYSLVLDKAGVPYSRIQDETGNFAQAIVADRLVQVHFDQSEILVAGGEHMSCEAEIRTWIKVNFDASKSKWKIGNPEAERIESCCKLLTSMQAADLKKLDWTIQLSIAKRIMHGHEIMNQGIAAIADTQMHERLRSPQLRSDDLGSLLAGALKNGGLEVQVLKL